MERHVENTTRDPRRSITRDASAGTTLIETLVATAFFLVFSVAIYQLYAKIIELSANIRIRTVATEVATEQFELIRNLQYYDVGTIGGIPSGVIAPTQTVIRNGATYRIDTTIRNIDQPADGTIGGTPNDLSPADNKLVEVSVLCTSCAKQTSVQYTSWIAPKSLETENGNGAIVIRAIDANGMPVAGANVSITNSALTPAINIQDITDASGTLTIVDAPPSTESYAITVTKNGYSTESTTSPSDAANPNPTKPHLTVSANSLTQSTFAIDKQSTLAITTETAQCATVPNISGSLTGTKLIGTTPDIIKHIYDFTTNGSGSATLSGIEWDTYRATVSNPAYDVVGVNPLQPVSIAPGTSQHISFTLRANNPNTLHVVVSDATSGLALAGATVALQAGSTTTTKQTSIGSITQTDWSGGGGQSTYTDTTKFWTADGGIDYTSSAGSLSLGLTGSLYAASGTLTSSVIDLGSPATFTELSWAPVSQPVAVGSTPVRFQIATASDNTDLTVWNFVGPDGTSATSYTTNFTDISTIHDNSRFIRYRLYLSTLDQSVTPTLTDVSLTYTSGCLPPGQTDFGGLANGTYTLTVSKTGYATEIKTITISGDDTTSITLSPS